jgi:hypothetical protein
MDTNITEKVERYNEIGQVVRVTLRWRGKIYYLQMFFPGSKFPSRGEVETQVKKIYPDAVVMVHYASETQPNQPLIRVTEERDEYGDPVDGPKIPKKEREKNLKKNEKDEDHTTTTNERRELKYGNYGNYISGQTREPTKKEYINPKKLPVANASYEPTGETISEEEEEKQNPTFVQFMQRIEQLPEVTREAIKNCGNDPAIAKAALEISGIDK